MGRIALVAGEDGSMKGHRRKTFFVPALLLILLGTIPVPCAATDYAKGISVPVNPEFQSRDPGITFQYFFSNDSIVFLNLPDTKDPRYPPGLYLYSIERNETRKISVGQDESGTIHIPDTGIFGDAVIYRYFPSGDIFHVYNSTTGRERILPDAAAWGALKTYHRRFGNITIDRVERADPALDGDRIVWTQGFSTATNEPETDLYLMNLTTGEVIPVCEAPGRQERPSISGRYIVWEDARNGVENPDIYLYDLETGRESPVCTDPSYQRYPVVSGDYVAWIDLRNGFDFSEVRMYHIPTGTETVIGGGLLRHELPVVSGNRIAYLECVPYSIDARGICQGYFYDITTGTIESLPKPENSQAIWAISGDRILFSEESDTDRQLYLFTLENRTPARPAITTVEVSRQSSAASAAGTKTAGKAGVKEEPGFDLVPGIAAVFLAGLILSFRRLS